MNKMKRKALIIGNTSGETGVGVDVANYSNFLTSDKGGAWDAGEVDISLDPTRAEILCLLARYKRMGLDYFMLIFAGHGGFSRRLGETVMELSSPGGRAEDLNETETLGVAPRQLNILDCCRCYYDDPMIKEGAHLVNASFQMSIARSIARGIYDDRLRASCKGTSTLYACSIGQTAEGESEEGGVFSNALLDMGGFPAGQQVYSVAEAMKHAKEVIAANPYATQTPSARLPRCMANQQLPWAVTPLLLS